jgi:ABC-type transporter Mla subunit MlaD
MAGRKAGSEAKAVGNGRQVSADLDAIEREHVEQLARAHAALAAAQDRSYWLDRWGLDLNALMRRPWAHRLRALLRALRELQRGAIALQRYARTRIDDLRRTAAEDDLAASDRS